MKTFVKILVLATVVVVALWSIFYFSGTRIAENIDVSDITINDSVYLNDVEGRIANISSSWKSDFLDIDNLISVYYRNNLLSADKEENLKILLVDTAGLQLTTYAIDYFKKSSWNKDCISTLEKDVDLLLRYRSATNKLVVHGDIKNKLKDDTKYSTVFFSHIFNSWLCGLLLNSNNKTCNSILTETKYHSKKCQQDQYEHL